MSVFTEFLEEAYSNETDLSQVEVELYVLPLIERLLETLEWDEEDVLTQPKTLPSKVQDYFATEFERCSVCEEWERRDDLVQARYDVNELVCESCREDGN
jgi:hypothetical protein